MRTFLWPSDGGWPYPDTGPEVTDPSAVIDDDMVSLLADSRHLLDGLDDLERRVITCHYGLNGEPPRTMKQLHGEFGLPRAELREALGSGLEKLRASLR